LKSVDVDVDAEGVGEGFAESGLKHGCWDVAHLKLSL
jgi:hypothetical protein